MSKGKSIKRRIRFRVQGLAPTPTQTPAKTNRAPSGTNATTSGLVVAQRKKASIIHRNPAPSISIVNAPIGMVAEVALRHTEGQHRARIAKECVTRVKTRAALSLTPKQAFAATE